MRVFLCLISVLSLSCAQLLLDNTIELDPEGTFRLDWSVIYDNATNPLIDLRPSYKLKDGCRCVGLEVKMPISSGVIFMKLIGTILK